MGMTKIEAMDKLHAKIISSNLAEKITEQEMMAFCDAKNALEKQMPKSPIEQFKLLGLDKGGKCPSCRKHINNTRYWMYCECGQRLNWS